MFSNIIKHYLILYIPLSRTFFPFTIPSRESFSRQFLLSQWPSQFLFFLFISSTIILPSSILSSTTKFFLFCLSISHAPAFSTSTYQMFPAVFAHSVVVLKSLHRTTLHSTQSISLVSSLDLFSRSRRKYLFSVKIFFAISILCLLLDSSSSCY